MLCETCISHIASVFTLCSCNGSGARVDSDTLGKSASNHVYYFVLIGHLHVYNNMKNTCIMVIIIALLDI